MTEDQMDRFLLDVTAKIMKHGWVVQGVFGTTPDESGRIMSFSYTVGLTETKLPELFLDTISANQATPILNEMARRMRDGMPIAPGDTVDLDYSVPFRIRGPIDPAAAATNMARNLYGDQITVLQVLWPDPAGLFPGDAGYDEHGFPQRLMPLVQV